MNDHELLRYSRHILLDEIGIEGQQKLLAARALVVGCGGLGNAALPYLAAAGVGSLIIADDDTIDDSNLQRQIMFAEADLGRNKAEAMAGRLKTLNGAVDIQTVAERLDEARLTGLMEHADIVLDCCDNFATRQAVNRAAVATRTPLVSGAAVRFEGQLAVYRPDLPDAPCYACLFDGGSAGDGACALFGVFSPLVGIIGTAQAAEALKVLLGIGGAAHGILRVYNALSGDWQRFEFKKNPACRVCAHQAV
ncbi:HesA/MoeB/ThiF family protein [Neisseria chenwenguii]|uniref:Molybdopterin-synthase adenylyltransferase MoeB n=1 Tax=Neisseria chenwenguii TaxID=1853278 RepID=A0A220S174_9NEIS|nr:HesA/MoeB/ThiF family protein [Neisseria chenwenguii]ASK27116.1 molybdopterin-synthase adenylyltransferase MoeB [Neisseria chenwenguii]ROV54867.1 HesA/MoeB/ThiF family protein [Neisseria chenwenguii]